MNLIKAMVDEVFGRPDRDVSDILAGHVAQPFRQRTDGVWEDRTTVVKRLETLRESAREVRVRVISEFIDARSYAERHVVTVITNDDTSVSKEVFVFGELDEDGRFLSIEELSTEADARS